jgi:hypothetical protein
MKLEESSAAFADPDGVTLANGLYMPRLKSAEPL